MYESAHLISSRTTTEFAEFPMRSRVDYPGHRVLKEYFDDYAEHFGLAELFGSTPGSPASSRATAAGT